MNILFLSHTHRQGPYAVGSHHLSRELAKQGHNVAHVTTPLSLIHRLARRASADRTAAAKKGVLTTDYGVVDFMPSTILPASVIWTRRQARKVLREVGMSTVDVIFLDQPLLHSSAWGACHYVFRPTDVFERRSSRWRVPCVMRAATGVLATSRGVLSSVGEFSGPSAILENGVELSCFAVPSTVGRGFVYVGAVDARFDLQAVVHLARQFPGQSVDIYGPTSINIDVADIPENLRFHGPLDYNQLPTVLNSSRVGILPFLDTPRNTTRSPMKLYEYMASGLYILAPAYSLPDVAPGGGFEKYGSYDEMVSLAEKFLGETTPNVAGVDLASEQDWSGKAAFALSFALGGDARLPRSWES